MTGPNGAVDGQPAADKRSTEAAPVPNQTGSPPSGAVTATQVSPPLLVPEREAAERLQSHLEQDAAKLAEISNDPNARKAANDFMAKLQQGPLTSQQLVQATTDFTQNFPSGMTTNSMDEQEHRREIAADKTDPIIYEMKTSADNFASTYKVQPPANEAPTQAPVVPAVTRPVVSPTQGPGQ